MLSLALALTLATAPAPAQASPAASIAARLGQEDGKPELIATVLADGKPLPNAGVSFQLVRSFGRLALGEDTTLDDGTAAAPFPKELRADAQGGWTVDVSLTSPDAYQGQTVELRIPGDAAAASPRPRSAPRELWARRAPWSLLATVLALAGSAWAAYGFVVYQLFLIKKGGQDA